jgi:8-hydroxy-5-deazaflavin:NADPH oxidoreductase
MRIGIIGAGKIGGTLTKLFVRQGHEVAVANSRGPETLAALVAEAGEGARAATLDEAADFGEVVVVAIPMGAYRDLPAGAFSGKIVVDANNYYPARDGEIDVLEGNETTSTELLAEHLRGSRAVKAFNTLNFRVLEAEGRPDAPREERLAIFLAGDDEGAKRVVAGLIDELGFAPVDTGSLADGGRRQQPGSPVYNAPMTASEA